MAELPLLVFFFFPSFACMASVFLSIVRRPSSSNTTFLFMQEEVTESPQMNESQATFARGELLTLGRG